MCVCVSVSPGHRHHGAPHAPGEAVPTAGKSSAALSCSAESSSHVTHANSLNAFIVYEWIASYSLHQLWVDGSSS